MLTIATNLEAHLQLDNHSLTLCWKITKRDATTIFATAHDRPLTIDSGSYAGTYESAAAIMGSDIAASASGGVDNMEVEGAFQVDVSIPDITDTEIEGGVFDNATVVLLMLNWKAPNDGQKVLMHGTLGEFFHDSDGRYRTEIRSKSQRMQQEIIQTYSERCNVKLFGDSRCGFNVAGVTRTGTVDSVTNRKRFAATLDAGSAPVKLAYYLGGIITFTSGDNDGFAREVRAHTEPSSEALELLTFDEFPEDIAASDTFTLSPGCDRLHSTCKFVHENIVNFRGYGVFATGKDAMMKDPREATFSEVVGTILCTPLPISFQTETEYDAQRTAISEALAALFT